MKAKNNKPKDYVHGYTETEQTRLYQQARFLEGPVYEKLDLSGVHHLLEVGSGVGAQTAILLRRYPHIKIDCVDVSEAQLAKAKTYLKEPIAQGRVRSHKGNGAELPFEENTFDGAFLCWFLEHVGQPIQVLSEIRRVLKSGGRIFLNETLNSSFFIEPYSPATLQFLFSLNDHQWEIGGDPFVGAKLGNLLMSAGFQNISTWVQSLHFDNRAPKMRSQMVAYWTDLLLSASDALLKTEKIDKKLIGEMKKELDHLRNDKDSVFFDAWIQAVGFTY